MENSQKSRKFISRNPKSPTKSQSTAPNSAKTGGAPKSPNDVKKVRLAGTRALNLLALGIGNTMAGVLTFKIVPFSRLVN